MGEKVGVLLEEDIPKFFVKLGRIVEDSGMDYKEWSQKYPDEIEKAAEEFIK